MNNVIQVPTTGDLVQMDQVRQRENDLIALYGYIIHCEYFNSNYPNFTNIHTHGLHDSLKHPDLQICLPLKPFTASKIIHQAVDFLYNGNTFAIKMAYLFKVDAVFRCYFAHATESDRSVLRILIADDTGGFIKPYFMDQLQKLSPTTPGRQLEMFDTTEK